MGHQDLAENLLLRRISIGEFCHKVVGMNWYGWVNLDSEPGENGIGT